MPRSRFVPPSRSVCRVRSVHRPSSVLPRATAPPSACCLPPGARAMPRRSRSVLNGVGSKIPVTKQIRAKVMAKDGSCTMDLGFFVIPGLSDQPARTIGREELDGPVAKSLADPEFHHPGPIDAILWARVCFDALRVGLRHLPNGLTLQNSKFGWLIRAVRPELFAYVRRRPQGVPRAILENRGTPER